MEFARVLMTETNLIQDDNCETVIKHETMIQCRTCPQNYAYFDMIT
jgi:hypothetical protein